MPTIEKIGKLGIEAAELELAAIGLGTAAVGIATTPMIQLPSRSTAAKLRMSR